MEMVNVKINGIAVSVPKGSTILEAARTAGVEIPTLCFMKEKNEIGACRICVVEATGARGLVTACVYPVAEGMEYKPTPLKYRKQEKQHLNLCFQPMKRSVCRVRVQQIANCRNFVLSTVLRTAHSTVINRITSWILPHRTL